MKHATKDTLTGIEPLLQRIRRTGLKEKSLGVFYRKSKPFLHFHEDPKGLFADLVRGADFDRYPVNTPEEQKRLIAAIDGEAPPDPV
ncbi:hypothetical protein J2D73_13995 [Acetobacter sacchari]|uniref:Uncharacterized protein n=1 Tax=Acetobacter sacchari TaxID=2661687 RepID=A0ABS3LYA4_9PROT|nr:hypothetical protein [Acetobacter sacchari]MBO1360898.1 hypothetical protein [Acetobacter sacchari]